MICNLEIYPLFPFERVTNLRYCEEWIQKPVTATFTSGVSTDLHLKIIGTRDDCTFSASTILTFYLKLKVKLYYQTIIANKFFRCNFLKKQHCYTIKQNPLFRKIIFLYENFKNWNSNYNKNKNNELLSMKSKGQNLTIR